MDDLSKDQMPVPEGEDEPTLEDRRTDSLSDELFGDLELSDPKLDPLPMEDPTASDGLLTPAEVTMPGEAAPEDGDDLEDNLEDDLGSPLIPPSPFGGAESGESLDDDAPTLDGTEPDFPAAAPFLQQPDASEDDTEPLAASLEDQDLPKAAVSVPLGSLSSDPNNLDSQLLGAFDSVFSGELSDPFAAPAVDDDDADLMTRAYSPKEMAHVEVEKLVADMDEVEDTGLEVEGVVAVEPEPAAQEEEEEEDLEPVVEAFSEVVEWYVPIAEERVGPISEVELSAYWDQGQISRTTLAWKDGQRDWMPICDIMDLHGFVVTKTAPKKPPKKKQPAVVAASLMDSIPGPTDVAIHPDPFSSEDEPGEDPFSADGLADDEGGGNNAGVAPDWKPQGMTDIYQADAALEGADLEGNEPGALLLAEASDAVDDVPQGDDTWQPGAFAALSSLVEDEISTMAVVPPDGPKLASAEDSGLDFHSVGGLPSADAPMDAAPVEPTDPFSQQIFDNQTDDVEVAQIAGQSSMVMNRPSYLGEAESSRNWPLIIAAVGGGVLLAILCVVIIVLLLNRPKQVAFEPGREAVGEQTKVVEEKVVNGPGSAKPDSPSQPEGPAQEETGVQPSEDSTKTVEPAAPEKSKGKDPEVALDRKPEEKPDKKKPTKKSKCNPILYPDGNCPSRAAPKTKLKKGLDKKDILTTVRSNRDSIDKCVSEQARRNRNLATGTLKMQWWVRPNGRTKNVAVLTPKYKGTYLAGCVQAAIKKWKFPMFSGEEVGPIKFPFALD